MKKIVLNLAIGAFALTSFSAMASTLLGNTVNFAPTTPGCTVQSIGGHGAGSSSWVDFRMTCPNGTATYQVYRYMAYGSQQCSVSSTTPGYFTSGVCSSFGVYKN